jgi:hypothetical protein
MLACWACLETCESFVNEVEEIICAETPRPFWGVERWYKNFAQTSDEEDRCSVPLGLILPEVRRRNLREGERLPYRI